ncbi:hypothetical protein BDA96_10G068000 [Sorghum bicolor]|uniref:Uncharacterized protein n=1 Tax=Sorghum bicolor TaxID=4558 RepID=A0A921TZV6_SORBI|nr:hypothetical protein BDA96_10G068000 [Sorghum bicolor]
MVDPAARARAQKVSRNGLACLVCFRQRSEGLQCAHHLQHDAWIASSDRIRKNPRFGFDRSKLSRHADCLPEGDGRSGVAPEPVKFGRSINLTISIRAARELDVCMPALTLILRFSSRACPGMPCDARACVHAPLRVRGRPAGRWQNGVRARPVRRRADRG